MFWDKGYTPSHNIEELLQKESVTVEEFLDEEDILQECKSQKKSIVNYFTRPDIIRRLIELSITEPPEDEIVSTRFRYANMACEILALGLPSMDEKLVEDTETLKLLYSYLENEPPLNPLLSSFFCKTFSMLLAKKDQDWFLYQKTCLQLLEYIKFRENFLDLIFKHFSTTVIPDLLMQMIKDIQGAALKKGLYEWLVEQRLVPRLIELLKNSEESDKHTNVADFVCDLIRDGRAMRQTEQEFDSFEPAFVGSNPILQTIESEDTVQSLLNVILQPNTKDVSVVSAIIIVLTLMEERIVDDTASERSEVFLDKEREHHKAVMSTIIKLFLPALEQILHLLNPDCKTTIRTTAAVLSPPFGMARLQVCRLFSVLLRTGNKEITNQICKTNFFNTLLSLFKEFCWNNFLHGEVEKCIQHIFTNSKVDQNWNNDKIMEVFDCNGDSGNSELMSYRTNLQTYVIVECKLISKLIDCWMHNKEIQLASKGRRLGYMGYLIKILTHIASCTSESNDIRALIESNLSEGELISWGVIMNEEDGEYVKCVSLQESMLANCNAHVVDDFGASLPREFFNDSNTDDFTQKQLVNENVFAYILKGVWKDENVALDLRQLEVCDNIDEDEDTNDNDMDLCRTSTENAIDKSISSAINPWSDTDLFCDGGLSYNPQTVFGDFSSDNFADFDSHFSSFQSDLGNFEDHDRLKTVTDTPNKTDLSDTNANITNISSTGDIALQQIQNNESDLVNGSHTDNDDISTDCNEIKSSPTAVNEPIGSYEAVNTSTQEDICSENTTVNSSVESN